MCAKQCDGGVIMRSERCCSVMGYVTFGHILSADSNSTGRTQDNLQHLDEQLLPGWSSL